MKMSCAVWSVVLAAEVLAGQLPDLILPAGVGVNIHFTRGHTADLDAIAEAGFKVVRMDFGWSGIERRKGEYDWSAYDELTANLEKRGLRALYILDYSNSLYEETVLSRNPVTGREQKGVASPQHPESVAAFARWAGEAARHFRGRRVIWEIWNEPNISFWKPKPDVRQYIALASATGQAIREADPDATVVGPATSEFPWEFLGSFLNSEAREYLDAVSVHPYRNYAKSPETVAEDYRRFRRMIEDSAEASARKSLPILSGEWGYASHRRGVSIETQAAFIARQQLVNLYHGVPISIWYDWKNDGTDPDEKEHNFGTVSADLKPKPAYIAVQVLTRELGGFRILRRLDVGSDADYALLLANSEGARKLAFWTSGEPHAASVEIQAGSQSAIPGMTSAGTSFSTRIDQKRVSLEFDAAPKYLTLGSANFN